MYLRTSKNHDLGLITILNYYPIDVDDFEGTKNTIA